MARYARDFPDIYGKYQDELRSVRFMLEAMRKVLESNPTTPHHAEIIERLRTGIRRMDREGIADAMTCLTVLVEIGHEEYGRMVERAKRES